MSLFGKNIRKIRSVKGLSQQAFAEIFDLKRGALGAYEEGRSEPKIDNIIKIANYFSITIDDILTKELTVNQLLKFRGDLEDHIEDVTNSLFVAIPCITPEQYDNYIKKADSNSFINSLPFLTLPLIIDKKRRAFIVDSLEMTSQENGLLPKDIVIAHWVDKKDFKTITGEILCLLLTEDELLLTRIHNENSTVIIKADRKGIEERNIKYSKIKELWEVTSVFYNRVPYDKNNIVLDKLAYLENEFLKLKSTL